MAVQLVQYARSPVKQLAVKDRSSGGGSGGDEQMCRISGLGYGQAVWGL